MFKWLKNSFIKFIDNSLKMNEDDLVNYKKEIRESIRNRDGKLFDIFNNRTFEYIYDVLLDNSEFQLIFFIKNFESIFFEDKFSRLKYCLNRGVNVKVYTFDGNKNIHFQKLEKEYKNFKYIPLTLKEGSKASNFIISDYFRYWLEDTSTTMKRNNLFDNIYIKSCCEFYNYNKVDKLLNLIEDIDKK